MKANGTPKKPTIAIYYDAEEQSVEVTVDNEQIKNAALIAGILNMALDEVKHNLNMIRVEAMARRQMEQAQSSQIRRNLGM